MPSQEFSVYIKQKTLERMKKMKKKLFHMLIYSLILSFLTCASFTSALAAAKNNGSQTTTSAKGKNDMSENTGKKMLPEKIFKLRYENFSSSSSFIPLTVKNQDTQETTNIVYENTSWLYVCVNTLKLIKNEKQYSAYMKKNLGTTFTVPSKLYDELRHFKADDSYQYLKQDTSKLTNFLTKSDPFSGPGGSNSYYIKTDKGSPNFYSLLYTLLDFDNTAVQRGCVDGRFFVVFAEK